MRKLKKKTCYMSRVQIQVPPYLLYVEYPTTTLIWLDTLLSTLFPHDYACFDVDFMEPTNLENTTWQFHDCACFVTYPLFSPFYSQTFHLVLFSPSDDNLQTLAIIHGSTSTVSNPALARLQSVD